MESIEYAGFWRRVAAYLIDSIILWLPASLFRWVASDTSVSGTTLLILDFIYVTIVWVAYYGFFESSRFQATLGKQVLKLKVVDYEGRRISFNRAVGRYLAIWISALPLGMGIFMIGWTKKKQGFHDMLAKCLVIRKKRSTLEGSLPDTDRTTEEIRISDLPKDIQKMWLLFYVTLGIVSFIVLFVIFVFY